MAAGDTVITLVGNLVDDPELLLTGECLLANDVPTLIELALVPVAPVVASVIAMVSAVASST